MSTYDQISSGFNFQNVAVDYRYGSETSQPISGFSEPINQKQINFSLLGKSNPGVTLGATKVVAEPLFEEFDEVIIYNSDQGVYQNPDPFNATFIETTKILRLTGLNIINFGDGYTTDTHPIELTFSDLGDPRVSGGVGQIFEQPVLDITTINNGGLGGFNIVNSGRFQGSTLVQAFTGRTAFFERAGTGFFEPLVEQATFPPYRGTGLVVFNETISRVEPFGVTTTFESGYGTFTGEIIQVDDDTEGTVNLFIGTITTGDTFSKTIEIAFDADDYAEFTFTETGSSFEGGTLLFTDSIIEPTYVIDSSNPKNLVDQDDIRNGINYSNWNTLTEDPIDRQAYTHVITNPNVSSVSAILDIKALGDTKHKAEHQYVVTEKPGLFGGDLRVDLAFRIGNPIDTFLTIKFEYGFLGADDYPINEVQTTYRGQTIGGYLIESDTFAFDSYKSLQQYSSKYSDLTIEQLKSSFPKYIRVAKDMFETTSSLITRNVMLDSIKEIFDTEYSYPSSAIVATKINSTYFDTIPTRTYDAKLKKVWVPENYNIEHFIEDKRFRREDQPSYDPLEPIYLEPMRVGNHYSKNFGALNSKFGNTVAIEDKTLVISDNQWGAPTVPPDGSDFGNIFIYQNLGKDMNHFSTPPLGYDFQMIRDGVPSSGPPLNTMSRGASNVPSGYLGCYNVITEGELENIQGSVVKTSSFNVYFRLTTAILLYINVQDCVVPTPQQFTHSLFLRISPKKSAILNCSIRALPFTAGEVESYSIPGVILPSYSLNLIAANAYSTVIGLVEDPYSTTPDSVLRMDASTGAPNGVNVEVEDLLITNTSEKKYKYVKFFTAQTRQVVKRIIYTPYGVAEYAYLLGFNSMEPNYINGAHPKNFNAANLTLADVSMKDYFLQTRDRVPTVCEIQGDYLVLSALKNRDAIGMTFGNHRDVLLILKLDANGFWYPLQDIFVRYENDGDFINTFGNFVAPLGKEPYSVSFFPGQNKFAVMWEDILKIQIYKLDDSGLFSLEDEIVDFQGTFKGYSVIVRSSTGNDRGYGECSVVNENTIVVSRQANIDLADGRNVLQSQIGDYPLKSCVFVYKKDGFGVWGLDDLIFNPEYQVSLDNRGENIKTHNEYLITSGKEYDRAPFRSIGIGVILLYRYNGKKYEFLKRFTSETIKNLNANGVPNQDNFDSFFGDYIGLSVDENNEPVIVTTAAHEDGIDGDGDGTLYIFRKRPDVDKWVSQKIRPQQFVQKIPSGVTPGFEIIGNASADSNNGGETRLAFDGKTVAVRLANNPNILLADSVGVFELTPAEKSNRLLFGNDWFGIMKKAWSDNPAWIIYDLLSNPIYGAGSALDDFKDINIFNFFEVSKYFDSADADGFYVPIYDERGRTEPRLSCNFLLDTDFNAFDVISSICDMFFGAVYIKEGKYNIWADRPTETSWYFNNNDVLDGNFSYSNTSKSQRPSLIQVPFLDKYADFKEKVEFIEDSDLIRKNGKNEVKLDFAVFTTRSQARRFGKHYLYNQSYETEKIKFLTDSKALFLNPGDVIGVNDKLTSFKNQKLFYQVESINHVEKVYAVTKPVVKKVNSSSAIPNGFTFSEITFKNSDTENFDLKQIKKASSKNIPFSKSNISLDNNKVPHVFVVDEAGNSYGYKRNGDDFDEVIFEENINYASTTTFESNFAFDTSNNPYFTFMEGATTEPTIGFCKLTGNDFTNTGDWQFTLLENLDASSQNFKANNQLKSVIRINSNNEKFIFTYRADGASTNSTAEYLLFHNNGIDDETNLNNWNRYVIDTFGRYMGDKARFEMQLTNDGNPALLYNRPIDQINAFNQLRYKEFVGSSLGNQSDWSGVFLQNSDQRDDTFSLTFDESGIPYVTHTNAEEHNGNYILSPLSYEGRFDYDNWTYNSKFIRYQNDTREIMQLEILANGSVIIFSANYLDVFGAGNTAPYRSLQFEEAFHPKDWGKYHNWNKQTVYKTEILAGSDVLLNEPSIAYDYEGCTITLKNADAFLFADDFSIDTSIENNLEISKLFAKDVTGLYDETQFQNFSSKIREEANSESNFITITGFETSGDFINLFAKKSQNNSRVIKEIMVDNPMVRPINTEESAYKEYRIINILEKEPNLYEVEAKEYFSGKFDLIDTYASIIEPEQAEYNIGLPDHEVIRPPEPLGIEFVTGLDDAGSPFLTGTITGEPNGSETEYRLSLLYPNGRNAQKEIEKNTLNLSSSNEFLTDFGFYNLAVAGDYEINVTSLRNPESSIILNEKFNISEFAEKISIYPFINDIDLLVDEDLLKVKIQSKNVYGGELNLFDSNCRVNLIIEGETYVENSKITDFEITFQQIKDLTNSDSREKEVKAQLTYNASVISEMSKILKDEAPVINDINFVSDGTSASIVAEILENEKLISVDMKTGETIIKTFAAQNQNKLQSFRLEDFEISSLPKNQKIDFTFTPKDFYGTGQSYNYQGYIPKTETLFEKYNNSIIPIYSIYSEDVISTGFSHYESSNNQSGFYGNGEDCLVEFSSSLLSGQSAYLNLELVSDTDNNAISIKFQDEGFLSSKKVVNLSKEYYNVKVSGESGLFGGFDLKVKKLV